MDKSRRSRDHILGHAPRDPFASSGAPPRKAAVDFSDVFGGPPLRFSGLGDAANVGGGRVGGVEEDGEHSRRWSASVAQKPVFGGVGVGSPSHRRHLGDDFFSDIFRGSESACPTPRKKDLDLFSPSTPGSRVLSPSRPLPPTSDVFGGVSSLPAHLSNSSRLPKSFDHSSSRFPTGFSLCRHDEGLPDELSFPPSPYACAPASPRQSSLSNMAPHGNRPLETATSAGDGADGAADGQLKKASAPSNAYGGSGLFHFSIYKWASKGVTLVMPSNFKGRAKSGSRLGAASSQVWHRPDPSLDKETVPLGTQSTFQNRSEIKENSPANDLSSDENGSTVTSNEVAEPLPAASDTKSVPCDTADTSAAEGKPELKDLRQLIGEISDGEGNGGMTGQVKKEEGLVKDCTTVTKDGDGTGRIKQESRKHTISGCTQNACSQGRHGASEILEDNTLPTKAKGGRVVEFIKIFSREATQKTGAPFESQSRRPTVGAGDHASARADQEENGKSGEASPTPITAGQSLEEEHKASMKVSGVEKVDGFSPQRGGASVSLPGSALDSLDASVCNMEETHSENVEECLVEDLSQDQNEVTEIDSHQEEIEIEMSDSRIQEWSEGKEGNIRSLLSTLQYVLWPGSGWKPVPLVDIIEGASVRRAYQKALLCLHPDKLQQKGAEAHQKYIAEKVFDMLQEAWDHFSSLS